MSSISLSHVTKRFRGETVLDDVSLEVGAGHTLVLFGPSGAGKTVLLRCIAGAVDPDGGQIRIDGEDMDGVGPEHRGVGMAFQNFALFPHMSAFENIAAPLHALRQTGEEVEARVEAVSKLLKIDHVLSHAPRALSNGQKQRTALARALVASPGVLLLDDPLRNVDAKLRFEMRLELPRLLEGRDAAVIYVTQDYKEAMALGDEIAVLAGGRIVQRGTPEDIYLRPATVAIARLFGDPAINLLDVVPRVDARGCYVEISGQRVALAPGFAHTEGIECVLGIRPEVVCFSDAPEAIPVTIDAETPFNEKVVTLVHTRRMREILVSRPSGTVAPTSGAVRIAVDAGDVSLFDRTSGARVNARETPAPVVAPLREAHR